jgi:starch-binding outer membrane protein, SusD/RagB family
MKKILIFIALAILLPTGYWSCREENLDLKPGSLTESDFFKTEDDFQRAVTGVYAKLTDFYWFNNNSPIHGFWQLPGDDVTTQGADPYEIFTTLQSADGRVAQFYALNYQMLNRANTVLEKFKEESGVYTTPDLKKRHLGQVLFLRGWAFFQLWNYFGTSPIVTERIRLDQAGKLQPAGSTGNQLLDQAIADFTEAAGLLPPSWDAANAGRVTSHSANAALGKSLVFKASITKAAGDYTAALTALNKVAGALVPDFASNFDADLENNAESLFEFQASQPGFDNVWLSNDFSQGGNGSTSAYWGWYENHWSLFGTPPHVATNKLIAAFDPADPRLPLTCDPASGDFKKYVLRDKKSQSGVASTNNPRLLRYADVLLLRAEAILQSGGSIADAVGLINQVRARARAMKAGGTVPAALNTAETDRNKALEWLRNERFVELAGEEGHRWFDLRRWHLGGQIDLTRFDFSSVRNDVGFQVKHLYYPIPQGELDLNPNVRQNNGYN